MKEELSHQQELLISVSNSLKKELDKPELSLVRRTYLLEKIEVLNFVASPDKTAY